MKAKIVRKEYYVAVDTNGKEYLVDIEDGIFILNEYIEGDIVVDEVQDKYDDGTPSRSYHIIEKFVPKNK